MCIANIDQDECIEFIRLFELFLISNVVDGGDDDDDDLCTIFLVCAIMCVRVCVCVSIRLHKKHDMLPPGRFAST